MKKKVDKNALSESCFIMNIPKTLNTTERNHISNNIKEDSKISLQNPLTPPQSVISSPNSKFKVEAESSPLPTEDGESSNEKLSPPISSLGPGAEIKGKICHPIPSSSKFEESDALDEVCRTSAIGSGGRLTFFKEGKLLLELSHRSEQGSWVQVKSKTYWPPPSSTTTTSIQHPLRHDTPTIHSDDCSSINSSPWSSDHIRKQIGPNPKTRMWVSSEHFFYIKSTPFIKSLRCKVRLKRNPFTKIVGPVYKSNSEVERTKTVSPPTVKELKFNDRKRRLEKSICHLGKLLNINLDDSVTVRSLFEKFDLCNSESVDPTFITPRKRYLKSLEADPDSHIRKKVHSCMSPVLSQVKHCDRLPSPSPSHHVPLKSAISTQNSSAYSIDSLLSSEPETKKSESFLRNLLRPDKSRSTSQTKQCVGRDSRAIESTNHLKSERGASPYSKERKDCTNDQKRGLHERFDLTQDLSRYAPHSNLSSLYLNPYLDPRYMMLHSLSTAPPFLPAVSQQNDMASAVAVAAAAAAGYPINPLHISALTANNLLPAGIAPGYPSTTSLTSQLIRSPNPNRSSPISIPHSPSPKLSPAPPPLPLSPHIGRVGSPREVWTPSSLQNSPHKYPGTSSVSPPPQEVPLNLTKPKRK